MSVQGRAGDAAARVGRTEERRRVHADVVRPMVNRRDVLRLGAASTVGSALGSAGSVPEAHAGGPRIPRPSPVLHTGLCEMLGIRHPVLLAPMARVVTPEMIVEVARAGGLGIVAGTGVPRRTCGSRYAVSRR